MADGQSNLKLAIDWIYVFYLPLTLILGSVISLLLQRMDRRKDKKEAERKAKEERKKADTEKILALLSLNYDEAVEKYECLKEHLNVLKEKRIATELETFTEFDVLVYICHKDKFERAQFTPSPQASAVGLGTLPPRAAFDQPSDPTEYGSKEVMSNVNRIMKFFIDFGIQLSVLEKNCPGSIRDEFSTKIFEMGATIYPFMTETRQKLIKKVLRYFRGNTPDAPAQGNEQTPAGCWELCFSCIQRCFPSRQAQGNENRLLNPGEIEMRQNVNQEAIARLTPYPGHDEIKRKIPYIKHFMYENGKMKCNLECTIPSINTLVLQVVTEKISTEQQVEICGEIRRLVSHHLRGDLLHQLRTLMFNNWITVDDNFDQYVQTIVNPSSDAALVLECERKVEDIETELKNLRERHKLLLEDEDTLELLESIYEDLREFISSREPAINEELREFISTSHSQQQQPSN